jgi:hypothetical protein
MHGLSLKSDTVVNNRPLSGIIQLFACAQHTSYPYQLAGNISYYKSQLYHLESYNRTCRVPSIKYLQASHSQRRPICRGNFVI